MLFDDIMVYLKFCEEEKMRKKKVNKVKAKKEKRELKKRGPKPSLIPKDAMVGFRTTEELKHKLDKYLNSSVLNKTKFFNSVLRNLNKIKDIVEKE